MIVPSTVTLVFDPRGYNTLVKALVQLPFGEVADLIRDIEAQKDAQLAGPPGAQQAAELPPITDQLAR